MNMSDRFSYGMDEVNISFVKDEAKQGKKTTLLVVTPRWDDSLRFVHEWLKTNRSWMDAMLLEYGAILVRGFAVASAADMEFAVKGYQQSLNNTYRGTSPRIVLEGTNCVFSAAEVPTNYPIAQHIEMSFLPEPPKQLYFSCLQPSKSAGGETALADFRKVYQDIPSELKQKFLDKGIRYTRSNKKNGSYFTYDVADMLGWPELFGTTDKAKVEEICRAEGTPFEWHGDTFVSTTYSSAFQLHPTTKEHVWFNHTQVFHWTTFSAELWYAWRRTHEWKLLWHFLLVLIFSVVKYGILGHTMGLHATFGDGQPISITEMAQIRKAIHKNMVFSRWQKGDLLIIDNFSTSHGRQPTYDKGRRVAVAWSDPLRKANEVVSLDPVKVKDKCIMENPQEKSPESTLTNNDSVALQESLISGELDKKLLCGLEDTPGSSIDSHDKLENLFHQGKQATKIVGT